MAGPERRQFNVRHIEKRDVKEVLSLIHEMNGVGQHSKAVLPRVFDIQAAAGLKRSVVQQAAYVAEVGGKGVKKIIGIATMTKGLPDESTAVFEHIFIHHDYQGTGLNSELVKARLRHAFDKWHAAEVNLNLPHFMKKIPSVYTKLGFKPAKAEEGGGTCLVLPRKKYLETVGKKGK
ncbi:MAG: GNAT family N-acetyltransferase [Candidatus Micrarchaeota archaeon]|nr:GNAT family N-acetyltransferase [Candidatus Micrarchaeota archaeon]